VARFLKSSNEFQKFVFDFWEC